MSDPKHTPNIIAEHGAQMTDSNTLTRKLDRYLRSIPVVAFGITLAASWEGTASGFQAGLGNGGPSSLVWGFLLAGPGTAMIVLSFAEMSSVDPAVGAQYRLGARYCPDFLPRRFVAFLQGWLTVFAWITNATVLPFLTASQILGLFTLNHPDYVYKGWHTTLLGYAVTFLPLLFNIYARRTLKPISVLAVILHFIFFVVFVVVLICLGGRNSAAYVFTGNSGGVSGWTSPTIQWCIGLTSVVFPLTGFDAIIHLSDEIKNPEVRVPRTMITSWTVNVTFAFFFMIILLFFMGDPDKALNTRTNWPIIEICLQAAQQPAAATALMCMIIVPGVVAYFDSMVSVSRLTWAFARDDGFPFSEFFKVVHPTLRMPLRALAATTLITMLLLLIPIGSEAAFNAIVSLSILALFVSYTLPCLFIFFRRLRGEHIVAGKWNLGRWGIWVNGAGSLWGIFISLWLCFPAEIPVTPKNMNWAGPIFGAVIIFSLIDWFLRGKRKFGVPLEKTDEA